MKKLLYSSIVLTLFSMSIILFQISCQEEAMANEDDEIEVQNKMLYALAKPSGWEHWISNIDGSDAQQIPITMPSGLTVSGYAKLTQDGKTLIFPAENHTTDVGYIYSINIDGTNLTKIFDGAGINIEQIDINQTF